MLVKGLSQNIRTRQIDNATMKPLCVVVYLRETLQAENN